MSSVGLHGSVRGGLQSKAVAQIWAAAGFKNPLGSYEGYDGVILVDNGKQNGNYYIIQVRSSDEDPMAIV